MGVAILAVAIIAIFIHEIDLWLAIIMGVAILAVAIMATSYKMGLQWTIIRKDAILIAIIAIFYELEPHCV